MTTFTLTNDHIKLIRNFYVSWQDAEGGAPEINPKRPYGNSNIVYDVHEILNGVQTEYVELTGEQETYYFNLHRETETALQIILNTGQFVPGLYALVDPYVRNEWKLIKV